jgi:hypothetical protein
MTKAVFERAVEWRDFAGRSHLAEERAVKRLLQAHGANQGAPFFPSAIC